MSASRFIACGMYASSDAAKTAWQLLFDHFFRLADTGTDIAQRLVFDADESVLRDKNLLFGHTCGYPLMKQLQDALLPFCLPCFEVAGASGKFYSSQFIVPATSSIESLQQCRGKIVAINDSDSNSGMNVLRHALAKLGARPGYFSDVLMTGGHLASLEAVATNRAQLAAIDCVTFQLVADQNPGLVGAVRVIGLSEQTCGLPFVMPRSHYSRQKCNSYMNALNLALTKMPASAKRALHLDHFEAVDLEDYISILQLENYAIEGAYSELN